MYNLIGQKVATITNGFYQSGIHTVTFDASVLSSGVYVYTLKTSDQMHSKIYIDKISCAEFTHYFIQSCSNSLYIPELKSKLYQILCTFLLCVALLGIPQSMVWAQTTGKIAGTVIDVSGESLPGVNVMINETLQGNATNAEGNYFILNIKPGSYTHTVSYIGFKTIRITDVQVV